MLEPIISAPGLMGMLDMGTLSTRNSHDSHLGRIALASQVVRSDDDVWLSIVNVVILCLTILGSGMILVSMFYLEFFRARPGTTRTRIVQALIVSDFLLGVVGLISSCLFLQGNGELMAHGSMACDGLGLLLTTILWTEHGWTLILAVATFMILIYPLHWFTLWIEHRWYYLWAIVWVFSIAIGVIGYEVYGFYPSGGTCFYGANAGLYSELMQFIPRCVVCIAITALYAKLYVFLKRPDKIRLPGSNSATGPYETVSTPSQTDRDSGPFRGRLGSLIPFRKKRGSSAAALSATPADASAEQEQGQQNSDSSNFDSVLGSNEPMQPNEKPPAGASLPLGSGAEKDDTLNRKTSGMRRPSFSPVKEVPPWEKLELPAFQVDGERFGGPSTSNTQSSSIWSGWRGMGSGRKRSSTTTANSANTNATTVNVNSPSRLNSISNSVRAQSQNQNPHQNQPSTQDPASTNLKVSPPGSFVPRMPSIPSEDVAQPITSAIRHTRNSTDDTFVTPSTASEKKRKKSVQLPPALPLSPKSNASSPEMAYSPKIDNRSRPSVTISEDLPITISPDTPRAGSMDQDIPFPKITRDTPTMTLPPRSDNPWASISPSQPNTPGGGMPVQQNFQFSLTPSATQSRHQRKTSKGTELSQYRFEGEAEAGGAQDEEDEDDEWDLARMLAQPPPGSHSADDRFAPRQSHTNGQTFELVPESMSSYLNRKTALLMLWFPLGYLFLFSVSLIRLVYDFAGNPPTSLRAISKWMVLAQGVLDAVIYGVVEWHTKRVVRKKVRKGTFSPSASRNDGASRGGNNTPITSKLNAASGFLRNIGSKVSASASPSASVTGITSVGMGTGNGNGNGNGQSRRLAQSQSHQGQGQGQTSSFFVPEDQDQYRTASRTGTEWNQNFSMRSIQEGRPFGGGDTELDIDMNGNGIEKDDPSGKGYFVSESKEKEKTRKDSESPLGGPGSGGGGGSDSQTSSAVPPSTTPK
ncbi:uncharacterized protein I303_102150 [Kwoniella dejecticola CBS 10117]|uniref:Glucose receptor Git3-like N-terminal domain-containing protein n=1 Tax=Kwoniella dejecticola CBS 10117 TaxID=1296121 RepID=A0A1A6ABR2_9TREE|nr:uncharacterized protein I303_01709 [Kwoniella dejecticola CBS 10117]OBR87502.1 hypothetical protein I303_01709 [Kwoniella dejecticola CBS 10117]